MNLLEEPWLPVRLHDGSREQIAPHQLSDPRIAAFDAVRADFNGALAQFAIGLLQTTTPVEGSGEWRSLWKQAPDAATLREWFAPVARAFEFDGEGARFMQDFDLREIDGEPIGIGALLIESPGENTVKNNSDHFIKRGQIEHLCPHCAAIALFTLQLNAPAGGAGHRTGLRGGGPLTTLLVADGGPGAPSSLWQSLWLNVRRSHDFAPDGPPSPAAMHLAFPWSASQSKSQKDGGQTTLAQTHPAHVFWAMPRRIRLDFARVIEGTCDLCGETSERLVHQYVTRNYGFNYKGAWRHPLSPYYESKEGWLPLHPQPDGLGYRHWLGWVLGQQGEKRKVDRAPTIDQFLKEESKLDTTLRLWAFGFDMDNMKARCWYETTMPIYALAKCSPEAQTSLRDDVQSWLAGAELAASYLRGAVKDAWFGHKARGDFSFVDAAFWSRTEEGFYKLLDQRIQRAQEGAEVDRVSVAESWLVQLRSVVLRLFKDELVATGPIERMNPARVAAAHNQLRASLHGPALRKALDLPIELKDRKATTKARKGKPSSTQPEDKNP